MYKIKEEEVDVLNIVEAKDLFHTGAIIVIESQSNEHINLLNYYPREGKYYYKTLNGVSLGDFYGETHYFDDFRQAINWIKKSCQNKLLLFEDDLEFIDWYKKMRERG